MKHGVGTGSKVALSSTPDKKYESKLSILFFVGAGTGSRLFAEAKSLPFLLA